MQTGDEVIYRSRKGREWPAKVTRSHFRDGRTIEVQIEGDPFPVKVELSQVRTCSEVPEVVRSTRGGSSALREKGKSNMAMTAEQRRAEVRELRDTARGLGIKNCDGMSKAELKDAITQAKSAAPKAKAKGKTGKAPATKQKVAPRPKVSKEQAEKVRPPSEKTKPKAKAKAKAAVEEAPKTKSAKASKTAKATKEAASPAPKVIAKKAKVTTPPSGDGPPNPFRQGTDRAFIFGLLLKGGTRRQIAEKAMKRLDIRTYSDDKPQPGINDYDKRVMLTAAVLRDDYKYVFTKDGRGLEATIKVTPPAPKVKKSKAKAA